MPYKDITTIRTVKLGGVNDTTGEENPKQLEGYFLGTEEVPSKYGKNGLSTTYLFQEKGTGERVRMFGTGGLNYAMKNAKVNVMTRVTNTEEERDTGKGNPVVIYHAEQDDSVTLEGYSDLPLTNSALSKEDVKSRLNKHTRTNA